MYDEEVRSFRPGSGRFRRVAELGKGHLPTDGVVNSQLRLVGVTE